MQTEAIAVHNPSNILEKAIQDAAKQITGNWLPSYPCELLAKAIVNLKDGSDWLEREDLIQIMMSHLFSEHMTDNKQLRIFPTHLLYLRDIFENGEINGILHSPIVFMTFPLALFLFRECLVHLHFADDKLRHANPDVEFLDVGGFLIVENSNVRINGVVEGLTYYGEKDHSQVKALVQGMNKAASKEIAFEVFEIDEHVSDLKPDVVVWDKFDRTTADIKEIEPGETGVVHIKYPNGHFSTFSHDEFNVRFTVV